MDESEDHTSLQENASTSHSNFTSTLSYDTSTSNPAEASTKSGKAASSHWSDQEINLLLDYVETHCSLNTSSGLNLKATHFNKARETVKSKDSSQCHYKWGHVCVFIIDEGLSR